MAVDKLVDSTQLNSDLTSIANAIRTKGGTSAQLAFPAGFVSAVEAIPTGGGGSSTISLLDTITVTSDTRAVNLDFTGYQDYNFFLVMMDGELSGADWLYIVPNGSSPTGGDYTEKSTVFKGIIYACFNPIITRNTVNVWPGYGNKPVGSVGTVNNLYLYTYTSSINIKAGTNFRIYGGNYADM